MKPLGHRHSRTPIAGHQECAICHPDDKGGKARSRREAQAALYDAMMTVENVLGCVDGESWPTGTDEPFDDFEMRWSLAPDVIENVPPQE